MRAGREKFGRQRAESGLRLDAIERAAVLTRVGTVIGTVLTHRRSFRLAFLDDDAHSSRASRRERRSSSG